MKLRSAGGSSWTGGLECAYDRDAALAAASQRAKLLHPFWKD